MVTAIRVVTATDLGDDFDIGSIQAGKLNVVRGNEADAGLVRFATLAEGLTDAKDIAVDPETLNYILNQKLASTATPLSVASYVHATNTLNINMSDGRILALDLTGVIDDAVSTTQARQITGTGLAVGGGDLTVDRAINVPAATTAQALAGSSTSTVITPATLKDATDALYALILNAPPATLDTLAEIATALGNDPNFATTITALMATKVAQTRQVNTTYPLQGGGALTADLTLSIDPAWSNGMYAPLGRAVTATGLASGGGDLTADRTITVSASTNAQAIAGTDTTTAMTPASTRAAYTKYAEAAAAPVAPVNGDRWYDTASSILYQRIAGSWVDIATDASTGLKLINGVVKSTLGDGSRPVLT